MTKRILAVLAVAMLAGSGCSMTSTASNFNGLSDFNNQAVKHQSTTNVALHVLFKDPLWGDASLEQTVSDFTREAKAGGAKKVRIVQSNKTTLWYILPPLSFFIQPVITTVAGDTTPTK